MMMVKRKIWRIIVSSIVILALALFVGCNPATTNTTDVSDTTPVDVSSVETPENTVAVNITEEQAKEIALEKVGGGKVKKIKLDDEDNKVVYEIKVLHENKKYEMNVDAMSGEITEFEYESFDKKDKFKDKDKKDKDFSKYDKKDKLKITEEQAKETALKETNGGEVIEVELDYENGKPVYEIKIINGQNEYEIDVDGKTGKIISFENDND